MLVDCSLVDIYVKDEKLLQILKENAIKYKYKNIKYITKDNDLYREFDC